MNNLSTQNNLTLAQRMTDTPSSATVRIADIATDMRRKGIDILDFSAGRASEHSPDYIKGRS